MKLKLPLFLLAISACIGVPCVQAQTAAYPSAIATDANLKVAVNGVSTLLTVAANISQTTLTISSCAGIVANVLITIDSEIMPVTGCSGTVLVVGSRGFDSTTAATHVASSAIYAYFDAWHHNSLRAEVEAIETSLGANLSNVLTSATGVASFNTRHGSVTLLAADVTAAVQALLTSSSPTFAGMTATGTGVTSTNTGGYAFVATQGAAGGMYYTGSGIIYSGVTTGHTIASVISADGTCTMRGDTGWSCPQALDAASKPTFAGAVLTAASSTSTINYIASETGANNAIIGTLTNPPSVTTGLTVKVLLAHSLQVGANTFNYNGTGAISIKSHYNPASNLGTAYVTGGIVNLQYDATGPVWLDLSE